MRDDEKARVVNTIDEARNELLDFEIENPPAKFESMRIRVDRLLRSASLSILGVES